MKRPFRYNMRTNPAGTTEKTLAILAVLGLGIYAFMVYRK